MTYRELQTALKDFRNAGYTVECKLNAKADVLEKEYIRLQRLDASKSVKKEEGLTASDLQLWPLALDSMFEPCEINPELRAGVKTNESDSTNVLPDPWEQETTDNADIATKVSDVSAQPKMSDIYATPQLCLPAAKTLTNNTDYANVVSMLFAPIIYLVAVVLFFAIISVKAVVRAIQYGSSKWYASMQQNTHAECDTNHNPDKVRLV